MVAVRRVDELGDDAELVSLAAHAPFQHGGDVQLLADLAHVQVLALEGEGRGAGDDADPRDVGERVDDLLGDAVGEVLVLLAAAQVDEGQHGDRRSAHGRRRGPVAVAHDEVPDQARRRRQHSDADERESQRRTAQAAGTSCGWRALDAACVDVEDPRQADDDGKTRRQGHHHIGEHRFGPVQPVHDGLDDLQNREGGDAVSHQRAEHAPSLQLGEQGQRHRELHVDSSLTLTFPRPSTQRAH